MWAWFEMMKEEPPRHALARSLTSSPQRKRENSWFLWDANLAVWFGRSIPFAQISSGMLWICPLTKFAKKKKMTRHCHGNSHAQHDDRSQIQVVHALHHYQDLRRSMWSLKKSQDLRSQYLLSIAWSPAHSIASSLGRQTEASVICLNPQSIAASVRYQMYLFSLQTSEMGC